MSSIGQNIKLSRERSFLTQSELASKIRVGTASIERYETCESIPNTLTILKICTVLDITVTTIMDQTNHLNYDSAEEQINFYDSFEPDQYHVNNFLNQHV
ncbi:helix-turn-helix domain-containing protein [Cytobacillus purgationiresistens]|uniref:Transcriptional regulator with XRE-family HTH domain n=1 Tax=Cytobacillus purgationiresistens TaxID=863449 RepID=A0ABU0AI16_9BACI|nr:helix-turn-helix transcriptional regulator [Cytobacillus purgationiresistens]MDQ0270898.1 transcriptional regulator with XRE-family HTH domain [Cytobacillus purgationiresistens]